MSGPSGALAFPRRERLRQAGEFQAVFQGGNRVERRTFVALWRLDPGAKKVGFAVSRQVRTAVKRNRVRRRLREAYRRRRGLFPEDLAMIFVGRPAALTADFGALLEDVAAAQATVTEKVAAERERRRGRTA